MNDKLREALVIVEKYGMKGDVIYKEIEALAAGKPDPQATTTNKHTERAELIRELKELAEALPFEGGKAMDYAAELVAKAAAMLEAQRPALRPLTDEQIAAAFEEHDKKYALVSSRWSFDAGIEFAKQHYGIKEQA